MGYKCFPPKNGSRQYLFNHGQDLESNRSDVEIAEFLYKQIHHYTPFVFIGGSHHVVLLSQNDPPIDKYFDLNSVMAVMPMGSSVPSTVFEGLKKNLKMILFVYNAYGMSELSSVLTLSLDVEFLGSVAEGAIVKIVDLNNGNLCGPNEVII